MTRLLTVVMLAAPQPGDYDPSTGKGPEWGKAAPMGLLVILLLGVALFFLLRSFTRQLKKVPATFDSQADTDAGAEVAESAEPVARVPTVTRADGDPGPPGVTERGPNGRAHPAG